MNISESNLNVARLLDVALQEDGPVAEGGKGLGGGRVVEGDEVLHFANDTHALAAASHGSLRGTGVGGG